MHIVKVLDGHAILPRQLGERACLDGGTPERVIGKFAVRIAEMNASA
jgi:hypothetical protein